MKESPILFSAPMVRAILSGQKTQTRRIAKLTDAAHVKEPRGHRRWHPADPDAKNASPYGQPGDRLWVSEKFRLIGEGPGDKVEWFGREKIQYFADEDQSYIGKYRPSIHMPRWASRITLEITDVRVERLQDISEDDAIAEGVYAGFLEYDNGEGTETAKESFALLWNSLNGSGSWKSNPWVWVVEFKRIQPLALAESAQGAI